MTTESIPATPPDHDKWKATGRYFLAYAGILCAANVVMAFMSVASTPGAGDNYTIFAGFIGLILTVVGIGMARNYRVGFARGLLAFIGARLLGAVAGVTVQAILIGGF